HGGLHDKDEGQRPAKQGETAGAIPEDTLEKTVVIDTLETTTARLIILPKKTNKPPKIWAIHTLKMHDVGAIDAMPFDATLTNGVPPGEIATTGSFGPWQKDDPGLTP